MYVVVCLGGMQLLVEMWRMMKKVEEEEKENRSLGTYPIGEIDDCVNYAAGVWVVVPSTNTRRWGWVEQLVAGEAGIGFATPPFCA